LIPTDLALKHIFGGKHKIRIKTGDRSEKILSENNYSHGKEIT
jgi:hypothetical protein